MEELGHKEDRALVLYITNLDSTPVPHMSPLSVFKNDVPCLQALWPPSIVAKKINGIFSK